jgi:hypothetical protein
MWTAPSVIRRNDHLTGNTLLGAGAVHHIIKRHMHCSKQRINLGAFGQVLGSLTNYNLASPDKDDLSVLRGIAPGHHGYIVEINPNGLCFEIGALRPRCHCQKLSLPGLTLLKPKFAFAVIRQSRSSPTK